MPYLKMLVDEPVIQAYVESSLPKDPAGRLQKVTEMVQSGMIVLQEGRRRLDFPDLGQVETLANAAEERIYQILDDIIDKGDYQPPDQFMPIPKATQVVVQYINLYATCKLEEEKLQMLRDWFMALQTLQAQAQPPMPLPPQPQPQALPMPQAQSPLVPNNNPQ